MREELVRRYAPEVEENKFIYKGLKFDLTVTPISIVSTDTEFYKKIDKKYYDLFINSYFSLALDKYLKDKYKNKINIIEKRIREEVNGKNNHISLAYLKRKRINYINRYAEHTK